MLHSGSSHAIMVALTSHARTIAAEIDAIRSGSWDDKIKQTIESKSEKAVSEREPAGSPETVCSSSASPTLAD